MKRSSKSVKKRDASPGDWVAHASGAPQEVLAIAASLKSVAVLLSEKHIDIDDVEVYQVPSTESCSFLGGGELRMPIGDDASAR